MNRKMTDFALAVFVWGDFGAKGFVSSAVASFSSANNDANANDPNPQNISRKTSRRVGWNAGKSVIPGPCAARLTLPPQTGDFEMACSIILCQYFLDDISTDISQPEIATGVTVSETHMIEPQQVHHRGVHVVKMHAAHVGRTNQWVGENLLAKLATPPPCVPVPPLSTLSGRLCKPNVWPGQSIDVQKGIQIEQRQAEFLQRLSFEKLE
jgi:hypothetical protein